MMSKELKRCLTYEARAENKGNFVLARAYRDIAVMLAKECKITEDEFNYIFTGELITAGFSYWLAVKGSKVWEDAEDDGWLKKQKWYRSRSRSPLAVGRSVRNE